MNVKKIDMTKGSMIKLIILFAIPIWIGNILQQLYNTVDTLVVGNYCGPVSIAAVGTSAQPVEFLLCIFLGLGTGVSILVSQNTGKGDTEAVKKVISTATAFLYMCAIPLTILGIFLGPLILKLMKVPADTFDLASTYLIIIFLGTLGNMGYNMNAGILRGIGDSISSLLFLLVSCVVNIVLDLVFVVVFHMGVHGVALATSIAMFVSWFISIIYIKNKHAYLEYKVIPTNFSKKILGTIIAVGLPLGLNNSIYSIGHILMQSLINAQGSTFIAACSVAQKLTGIANVAITALSSAATTFAGQNIGAKNYKRVKYGALRIPLFSAAITLTAGLILTLFCRPILGLFTNNSDVLKLATQYTYVVLPFTWGYALLNGIISYVNG
ncbi:MAG: MATE family efflux transporter, partial [Lachnospiraceae bacterium]|nr:MATE family efflux transporter [Lachnospiraceae bacterium]